MADNNKKRYTPQASVVYGMGFIGACIYFIMHAATFWMGAFGILKAIVWPALIVFKALDFFKL